MPETLSAPQTMQVTAPASAELPSVMGSQEQWWVAPTAEAQPIISVVPKVETSVQQQESTQTVEQNNKVSKSYRAGVFVGSVLGKFNKLGAKPPLFTAQEIAAAKAANIMPLEPYQNSMNRPVLPQPEAIWYAAPQPTNPTEAVALSREQLQALRGQAPMPSPEVPPVRVDLNKERMATLSAHAAEFIPSTVASTREAYEAKVLSEDTPENKNTAEIMRTNPATFGMQIGERTILLGDTMQEQNGRLHTVMYTQTAEGKVVPRFLYKSRSEGEWRVAPVIIKSKDDNQVEHMRYSKGEQLGSYVRETRLDDDLRLALMRRETAPKVVTAEQFSTLTDKFTAKALGKNHTYRSEVRGKKLLGDGLSKEQADALEETLYAYTPGEGFMPFNGKTAAETFAAIDIPYFKMPDFADTIGGIVTSEHPLLGTVKTEKIRSVDGRLQWHMSRDSAGRVWVSGITETQSTTPNSYGTDSTVIMADALDNKPLEYKSQIQGLVEGKDFKEIGSASYVDITPLLNSIKVIKDYRASRGITRTA